MSRTNARTNVRNQLDPSHDKLIPTGQLGIFFNIGNDTAMTLPLILSRWSLILSRLLILSRWSLILSR